MASSSAATVPAYLAELPADRRKSLAAVRRVVRAHLPKGYKEVMRWGLISYEVPLARYPDTYNGQPLCYAGLAAQKHYLAIYLMCAYQQPKLLARLKAHFKASGKKLDMGKCCLRFRAASDLPLPLIGEIIAAVPMSRFIAQAQAVRSRR